MSCISTSSEDISANNLLACFDGYSSGMVNCPFSATNACKFGDNSESDKAVTIQSAMIAQRYFTICFIFALLQRELFMRSFPSIKRIFRSSSANVRYHPVQNVSISLEKTDTWLFRSLQRPLFPDCLALMR